MNTPNFYSLIIGTEILNGRRDDSHFEFLRDDSNIKDESFTKYSGSFLLGINF